MANSIKLLTRSKILTEAEADDRQLCLSTVGSATAQDLADIREALALDNATTGYVDIASAQTVTGAKTFTGDFKADKTITAAATVGARTINKNAGSVNFAAAAASLVVTNSRVTTSSVILATVATVDATMTSVVAVAASGSFTLTANAAATAETRVNFMVIN